MQTMLGFGKARSNSIGAQSTRYSKRQDRPASAGGDATPTETRKRHIDGTDTHHDEQVQVVWRPSRHMERQTDTATRHPHYMETRDTLTADTMRYSSSHPADTNSGTNLGPAVTSPGLEHGVDPAVLEQRLRAYVQQHSAVAQSFTPSSTPPYGEDLDSSQRACGVYRRSGHSLRRSDSGEGLPTPLGKGAFETEKDAHDDSRHADTLAPNSGSKPRLKAGTKQDLAGILVQMGRDGAHSLGGGKGVDFALAALARQSQKMEGELRALAGIVMKAEVRVVLDLRSIVCMYVYVCLTYLFCLSFWCLLSVYRELKTVQLISFAHV